MEYFITTSIIYIITWIVIMICSTGKDRREQFGYIFFFPTAVFIVPIGVLLISICIFNYIAFDLIPNLIFKDKE